LRWDEGRTRSAGRQLDLGQVDDKSESERIATSVGIAVSGLGGPRVISSTVYLATSPMYRYLLHLLLVLPFVVYSL
jgi:hypothetical protein